MCACKIRSVRKERNLAAVRTSPAAHARGRRYASANGQTTRTAVSRRRSRYDRATFSCSVRMALRRNAGSTTSTGIGAPGPTSIAEVSSLMPHVRRQDGGNSGQSAERRVAHRPVPPIGHPARPERQRFDLFGRKHKRRQEEARLQDISHSRFALDCRALRLKTGDIPVERAAMLRRSLRRAPCRLTGRR